MFRINDNYQKLPGSYLFSETARRTLEYGAKHPNNDIIRLGIGDVTKPIVPTVIKALHDAVDEMGHAETFRGYCPESGYAFLKSTIAEKAYVEKGVMIEENEIFVSDGAKQDVGNIQELFSADAVVAVCDPVYPVYVDSNAMAGRAGDYDPATGKWSRLIYLPMTAENGFVPEFPEKEPDLIYICNPSNPTGTAMDRKALKGWVDYANAHGAVILYDGAYEAFIERPEVPHSIFEIEGARTCAIEFRSFSKTAGFTGLRLAYCVIPSELKCGEVSLNSMWNRRTGTKYNGAPYIVQKAGEAVFTDQGRKEIMEQVAYYKRNARLIRDGLVKAGFEAFGGVDSPYVWLKVPDGDSWKFFDTLLDKVRVVGTPGAGFGPHGEGYFRLTGFNTYERTEEAVERIIGM